MFDYDGADEDTDFEVVEVSDSRSHIGEWHDTADRPVNFGNLPQEGEVLLAGALDDEKPDEQKLMEATGNEGASFERAYHRAALVVGPRDRFADVLLQAGMSAVLPHSAERVHACGGAAGTPAQRRPVIIRRQPGKSHAVGSRMVGTALGRPAGKYCNGPKIRQKSLTYVCLGTDQW